jgi:serine/threonine protein kinase/CheY-like chemotaxis protein
MTFEIGELVGGNYILHRVLGRGGMSHVFEAEDVRLARRVALKVSDDAEHGTTSLRLEAKALAAVRHPGLPIVYDVGFHRGWTYLVMERLYGIDLERHLLSHDGRARRVDVQEGVTILASIAEVLASVHAAGMAHRDLKPSNVMLCPQRTVLLDFGIVVPEVDAKDVARCGTPRYLAPELVRGQLRPGRAHLVDAYAFGAMAFEMFTGRAVFESDSLVELLEHHLATSPEDIADLRPELPREISTLVSSCLAKNPDERPHDMEGVAGDLRALLRRRASRATAPRIDLRDLRETYRQVRSRAEPLAPAAIAPEGSVPMAIPASWDVLVVEDDPDIRDSLAALLGARGYRVTTAANGQEAQEALARAERQPLVILLDLNMPVMDGQTFLEHQHADPSIGEVPVLLITAQAPGDALLYPAVRGVVPKPVAMPALLRSLEDVRHTKPHTGT